MIFRLTTVHENTACRAGACPGLADASVGPTICAAVIFTAARNLALIPSSQSKARFLASLGMTPLFCFLPSDSYLQSRFLEAES